MAWGLKGMRPARFKLPKLPHTGGGIGGLNLIRGIMQSSDFFAPLQTSIVLTRGVGAPTFTRASTAYIQDFEGLHKQVLAGEARFKGARRVQNLITTPNFTVWSFGGTTSVLGAVSDPDGGNSAYQINFPAVADSVVSPAGIALGINRIGVGSVWLRADAPGYIRFNVVTTGFADVFLTPVWQRFSFGFVGNADDRLRLVRNDAGQLNKVYAYKPQQEDTTGQSNQNPSEYVSTGVLAAPFHGANVDGVKYFNTKNGNTVVANVVTENTGPLIGAADKFADIFGPYGYRPEGAGIQLVTPTASIRDMTNAAWVKGATITVAKTGTGIDGVANSCSRLTGGAVAGTNTILQTLVAAASSRTYSFFMRGINVTGSIFMTQDGGATWIDITASATSAYFSKVQLNATQLNASFGIKINNNADVIFVDFNQFEARAKATSPMDAAGAARATDVLSYPNAGNSSDIAGSIYAEVSVDSSAGVNERIVSGDANLGFMLGNAPGDTPAVYDGTTILSTAGINSFAFESLFRAAGSWLTGGQKKVVLNGGDPVAANAFSGNFLAGNTLTIGGAGALYGTIRGVRLWKNEIPSATLQALRN